MVPSNINRGRDHGGHREREVSDDAKLVARRIYRSSSSGTRRTGARGTDVGRRERSDGLRSGALCRPGRDRRELPMRGGDHPRSLRPLRDSRRQGHRAQQLPWGG